MSEGLGWFPGALFTLTRVGSSPSVNLPVIQGFWMELTA